jgi:Tol biopolymer transport system component
LIVAGDNNSVPATPEFSPDGRWLAYCAKSEATGGAHGLILKDLETGQANQLTNPGQQPWLDFRPRFSNDGQKLAFLRTRGDGLSITIVTIDGKEIMSLPMGDRRIADLVWDPTSRNSLLYTSSDGLWRISLDDRVPQLVSAGIGDKAQLAAAREGKLVAYVDVSQDRDIWECDISPGKAASRPRRLIASSRRELTASYSPDGNRIVLVSERSGSSQIWVCNADGTNMAQLTSYVDTVLQRPSWSPDGRTIAYTAVMDAQSRLCLIDVATRKTRVLTPEGPHELAPTWSRDGQWIYVSVQNEEYWSVRKRSFSSGESVPVTDNLAFGAVESPDASRVYYSRVEDDKVKILSVPVDGGPEQLLLHKPIEGFLGWDIRAEGFYYSFRHGPGAVEYSLALRDLDTGREEILLTVSSRAGFRCDVSPDGKKVIFERAMQVESDIIGLGLM